MAAITAAPSPSSAVPVSVRRLARALARGEFGGALGTAGAPMVLCTTGAPAARAPANRRRTAGNVGVASATSACSGAPSPTTLSCSSCVSTAHDRGASRSARSMGIVSPHYGSIGRGTVLRWSSTCTEACRLLVSEDRAETAGDGMEVATPVNRQDCSGGEGTGVTGEERGGCCDFRDLAVAAHGHAGGDGGHRRFVRKKGLRAVGVDQAGRDD